MRTSGERSKGTCSCERLKLKILRTLCVFFQRVVACGAGGVAAHTCVSFLHPDFKNRFKLTVFSSDVEKMHTAVGFIVSQCILGFVVSVLFGV